VTENELIFFSKQQMDEAFAKGGKLYNGNPEHHYQLHVARKTTPGVAEVHIDDTDIFIVADGAATLVTGGTIVDGKTTAPGEIRGSSIRDGVSRRIAKGDVMIIPNGLPHQITAVEGTFLNYVIKAR
jgi:glc operon protein GlcG